MWATSDGEALPGAWYRSKKGALAQVVELLESGDAVVMPHATGNRFAISADELAYFERVDAPTEPVGVFALFDATGPPRVNGKRRMLSSKELSVRRYAELDIPRPMSREARTIERLNAVKVTFGRNVSSTTTMATAVTRGHSKMRGKRKR